MYMMAKKGKLFRIFSHDWKNFSKKQKYLNAIWGFNNKDSVISDTQVFVFFVIWPYSGSIMNYTLKYFSVIALHNTILNRVPTILIEIGSPDSLEKRA